MTNGIRTLTEEMLRNYVCPELKEAAEAFIASADTPSEEAAKEKLLAVLPESIATIDEALAFAESDYAKEKFGAEAAAGLLAEITANKEKGEKYCGCPGCQTALKLYEALK